MKLRIFEGKKGNYNKFVLKVLYKNGYLTAYHIAKEVARFQVKPKENLNMKTLNVQSVLIRSNGRIEELEKKEYIQNTEKGYRLTFPKGIATALISYQTIEDSGIDELPIILEIMEPLDEQFKSIFTDIWLIYSEIYPKKEYYQVMLKATQSLIDEGLDIDVISNKKFNSYLELKLEEMLREDILKKEKKQLKPETYAKIGATFKKALNYYGKIMRDFEIAKKDVEDSLQMLNQNSSNTELKANV
jgi:hypothetical protein